MPLMAANILALMRIVLGLVYLWGFIAQGFGINYSDSVTDPTTGKSSNFGWHFSYDASQGWISSGFSHSPIKGFISATHGPLAFIPQDLPSWLDDLGWMVALAGLGIALTFGIFMNLAGIGGCILNILLWFSLFPPSTNPVIDGEHTMYAIIIPLFALLYAGNHWGFGRWWSARTPRILN
jgi:thiosulfate dehydrogenase [quinone] large subunit